MDNKQKQIEEIAKVIFEYVDSKDRKNVYIVHSGVAEDMKTYCHNYGVAKALYNANCRIIPEGSVVLTEEEFWKLSNKFSKKELDEIVEFHKKKTYKQAVTEILDKLHNKGQKFFVEAYSLMEDSEYDAILNETAKEFGGEL